MSQSISGTSTTAASSTGSSTGQDALASLTSNFSTFLQMLLTQLQNQDPTSPMDSSQFTTELVQFAGVEQQINTNSNLNQLIQLTQDNTSVQASQLVGKQVDVASTQLSLQNGTSTVDFTAPSAGQAAITITDSAGNQVYTATGAMTQGSNSFTWNGQTNAGGTAPDGVYSVSVSGIASDGSTSALPFTVVGTVTGVQTSSGTVQLSLGQLTVNMSALTSLMN